MTAIRLADLTSRQRRLIEALVAAAAPERVAVIGRERAGTSNPSLAPAAPEGHRNDRPAT